VFKERWAGKVCLLSACWGICAVELQGYVKVECLKKREIPNMRKEKNTEECSGIAPQGIVGSRIGQVRIH